MIDLQEHIIYRVDTSGGPDACWPWKMSVDDHGYGNYWHPIYKRLLKAHRAVYEIFVGPIPDGLFLCHHCDNPTCCNPKHMFIGTQQDNMTDMANKHRQTSRVGINNHNSKLTEDDVREIRKLASCRRTTGRGPGAVKIGKMYGVQPRAITDIILGKSWTHVV